MKIFFKYGGLILFFFSTIVSALDNYYCMNRSSLVRVSMSKEAVLFSCGEPTSKTEKNIVLDMPAMVEMWSYMPAILSPNAYRDFFAPKLLVLFRDNKVYDVRASGRIAASYFQCYRDHLIKTGDSKETVKITCGYPMDVRREEMTFPKETKVEEWRYQIDNFRPPTIFRFVNNVLVDIRNGYNGA